MKILISLFLTLFCVHVGFSQDLIEADQGTYQHQRISDSDHFRVDEVLYEETFSAGIPSTWTNKNFTDDLIQTDAVWEYRGPSTTPSNLIGTRGNCEEQGTLEGVPIISASANDGFVIFDSNYWDSSEGDCGSFGSGISPGNHNAYLTTPSFDFGDKPFIGISFTQYLRNYQASMKVQASVNGGEFENVYVSPFTGTNSGSARDMNVRKNVSSMVGGETDVRFRFYFDGFYYFWMMDDFKIVALQENNLEITSAYQGDYAEMNGSTFSSFQGLDYYKFPVNMVGTISPIATVENRGALTQTGVTLHVELTSDSEVVSTQISSQSSIETEDQITKTTSDIAISPDYDEYTITYNFSQNEEDGSVEDNSISRTIEVTDYTLARDEGTAQSFYYPSEDFSTDPYEVGTVYQINQDGLSLYSISAALGINSVSGSSCYARLYEITPEAGFTLTPVATSEAQNTFLYHRNDFGDERMMVFNFEEPIPLTAGNSYLAMVGSLDGSQSVTFAMSGASPIYSSWVKFSSQSNPLYLAEIPMVRMNFGLVTDINELEINDLEAQVYPNPISDRATITFNLPQKSDIAIGLFDINGRHIEDLYVGSKSRGAHSLEADLSTLKSGSYVIKIMSNSAKVEKKIVLE